MAAAKAVERMNSLRFIFATGARHHQSNGPRSNPGSNLSEEDMASSQMTRSRRAAACRPEMVMANILLTLLRR